METVAPEKDQPKLSREQKRFQERIESEAKQMFNALANKFLNYFVTIDDPEGQAVQDKAKEMGAQWRIFCKAKSLAPEAYVMFDKYTERIMTDFLESKKQGGEAATIATVINAINPAE